MDSRMPRRWAPRDKRAIYRSKRPKRSKKRRLVTNVPCGGSPATSPRRSIAAIIFKQAAPGRSIFSSGCPLDSNRPGQQLFSRLREGYFVGNATSPYRARAPRSPAPPSCQANLFYSLSSRRPFARRLSSLVALVEKRARDNSWKSPGKAGIREGWSGKGAWGGGDGERRGNERGTEVAGFPSRAAVRRAYKKKRRPPSAPIGARYRASENCSSGGEW